MWKPILFVAAALAVVFWVGHAKAAEEVRSPSVVLNFPLVCMDRADLLSLIGKAGAYPVWPGIRNGTFLSTLYLNTNGTWMLTEERAMSKTACILSSGEDNELLGIGGI
jgi:hypothetical protein